ncbi:2-amino-4-hydroxy-6-hydroxymethyldihydropteridine diphosphokinase [Shimia litoralis]|uniref:2-amino-4-hydroxy-6-hydroxymethyldihydropteridine pyrophosphokinase n=1 Tax=Shimia litoralis TaxID=420403 RepID=A0A4V6F212_9RHOB|nr:2-amino-4-hydroxy-6-hydroxymethyldihydropteridine diphosphokinase [Shimia litoralis]TKZ21061.1 2-amino-4-hydroxy-6-hydroxymethyldihydropteridine diphosphokinase [Shimia litoralis]
MNEFYVLALGGNLPSDEGAPDETLRGAISALKHKGIEICQVSRFYETPCFPAGAGPDYVNAAITVRSKMSAKDLLKELHDVEAQFGRARDQRWGMRTLDIDLIAAGDLVLPNAEVHAHWRNLALEEQVRATPEQLILPHPRLADRAFVLVPLNDIIPDWVHPETGRSVAEMLADLPESDRKAVIAL